MAWWSLPMIGGMSLALWVWQGPWAAAVPGVYCLATVVLLVALRFWDFFGVFCHLHNGMVLVAPVLVHIQLGGFAASGGVLLWCVLPPVAALMWFGARGSTPWFVVGLLAVGAALLFDPIAEPRLAPIHQSWLFAVNVCGLSTFAYLSVRHFVTRLEQEKTRSEALLANVLPRAIASRLRVDPNAIAERHEAVTVLFADLVGFTELARRLSPRAIVEMLNDVFTELDRLADEHGLEKIKTIGDAYMVVGGLPEPLEHSADVVARMALDLLRTIEDLRTDHPGLAVRIGVHTGPVVAGVIGRRRFAYDLWGDTVNTAARLESTGESGRIHVSQAMFESLSPGFATESRGTLELKGLGQVETWWLLSAE